MRVLELPGPGREVPKISKELLKNLSKEREIRRFIVAFFHVIQNM